MADSNRGSFGSKLGMILATAGGEKDLRNYYNDSRQNSYDMNASLDYEIGFPYSKWAMFIDPVIRHDALDHVPEVLRMVHMSQVAELVDYHIIQRTGRTVDQTVIEG